MITAKQVLEGLFFYSAYLEEPNIVVDAYRGIKNDGDVALEALVLALEQEPFTSKMLALLVLGHFGDKAVVALPALADCIDSRDRSVRLAAMETAGLMGEKADSLVPNLLPYLSSDDEFEKVTAAGNLFCIRRTEAAMKVLRGPMRNSSSTDLAAFYLRSERKPPTEWWQRGW